MVVIIDIEKDLKNFSYILVAIHTHLITAGKSTMTRWVGQNEMADHFD
jgi:hypothetical protein